jgi:hypothetical protein
MSSDGEGGAARKEKHMKCMILTCASQQDHDGTAGQTTDLPAWSPRDFAAMGALMEAFNGELVEPGDLIQTWALAAPLQTSRLGVRNTVPFDNRGLYGETHEVLAGYWIVEGNSFDRATEIAGRLAACPAPEHVAANAYADVRPTADSAAEGFVSDERRLQAALVGRDLDHEA